LAAYRASFQWGVINVDNTSIAAVQVGTTPANDQLVQVRATDWFIPEFTGSIHVVPSDAIDVVAGFHYRAISTRPARSRSRAACSIPRQSRARR
jgi:hypothetical protein